jgi:hypothetical protein
MLARTRGLEIFTLLVLLTARPSGARRVRPFFAHGLVVLIPYTLDQELGVFIGCNHHLEGRRAQSQACLDGLRVCLGGPGFKQPGAPDSRARGVGGRGSSINACSWAG